MAAKGTTQDFACSPTIPRATSGYRAAIDQITDGRDFPNCTFPFLPNLGGFVGVLAARTDFGPSFAPIREELSGPERLEQYAETLASDQKVGRQAPSVTSLHRRLNDNSATLLQTYRAIASDAEAGIPIVPAAEWLLDNYIWSKSIFRPSAMICRRATTSSCRS